jgi:hypothetical protein
VLLPQTSSYRCHRNRSRYQEPFGTFLPSGLWARRRIDCARHNYPVGARYGGVTRGQPASPISRTAARPAERSLVPFRSCTRSSQRLSISSTTTVPATGTTECRSPTFQLAAVDARKSRQDFDSAHVRRSDILGGLVRWHWRIAQPGRTSFRQPQSTRNPRGGSFSPRAM